VTLRVVDTERQAEKTFKTFYDREHREEIELPFSWPSKMQEIGVGGAEMYRSNKWQKNLADNEDYKHVAEGTRTVFAEPGFLREWGSPAKRIKVVGPMVKFEEPMPKHITRLGHLLGVQVRLYTKAKDGSLVVPKGNENRYEVSVARAWLGTARHPETKEEFLVVYSHTGLHMLLTGGSLTVEKDGIAG